MASLDRPSTVASGDDPEARQVTKKTKIEGDLGAKVVDIVKPLPSFPNEILHYIVKLSGSHDILTSAVLVQLCKKTHQWITPILYNVVLLKKNRQVLAFCRTLKATNLGSKVRTLIFRLNEPYIIIKHIAAAIRGCPKLETIFDSGFMPHHRMNRHLSRFPAPWQVATFIEAGLCGLLPPVGHPLLKSVTHLHIHGFQWPNLDLVAIHLIHSIPTLTHLACSTIFEWHKGSFWIRAILHSILSLRLLLVLKPPRFWDPTGRGKPTWEELLNIEDERLFVRIGFRMPQDYDDAMVSGRSIWDDVEIECKNWRTLALNEAHESVD